MTKKDETKPKAPETLEDALVQISNLTNQVEVLTGERDKAVTLVDELKKDNAKLAQESKADKGEKKRLQKLREAESVKKKYRFNGEHKYAVMTLCGENVEPKDGIWSLTAKQFAEASGHGCAPEVVLED